LLTRHRLLHPLYTYDVTEKEGYERKVSTKGTIGGQYGTKIDRGIKALGNGTLVG